MSAYDPKSIEAKWQKRFDEAGVGKASEDKKKKKTYLLVEFPYPSGAGLHTGHVRSYTAMDIIARKRRRQGESVLYPIGWDAFGLPTENYAIKTGRKPADITKENTDTFRRQMKSLGLSFDWSREVNTTDPQYYKWTQWIFLQLYKQGLAYKAKTTINWCPKDKIGLANEEVVDGACERCGTQVEKREKEQWMLAITKYAKRLYDDLDSVDYIERAKTQQKNWIGPSEGALISFRVNVQGQPNPNFLLLHGYTGSPNKDFFPWLKNTLEADGFSVQVPALPNSDNPSEEEQVSFVLKNCTIDENTIIVGHSLGAVVARRVLAKHGKPVRGLVQVASAVPPSVKEKPYQKNFTWDEDFETLSKLAKYSVIAGDTKEAWRLPYLEDLAKNLKRPLRTDEAKEEHFTNSEESALLRWIQPSITVFTTRADTLFGATYMVLAPEHPLVARLPISNAEEVRAYAESAKKKTDIERGAEGKEKTGVELKGIKAINPATNEEIPIYVADYVLSTYGTGAIMAVPARDERDGAFAEKFNLPFSDAELVDAKEITEKVGGRMVTKYKLRDWVFSRQRYWGEPIPMIWCEKDGWVAVPEKDLPVVLPDVEKYQPTDTGESPLANIAEFVNTTCPTCGGAARRETDVMPNWAGSSWYYLRYADPHNAEAFGDPTNLKYWTPVDWYNGGMEHTVLHLLYSRFWHKALFDLGLVPTNEPYQKRTSHGIILGPDGTKMSKSVGNVINPDEVVAQFGADTVRVYEMFMGPFEGTIAWSEDGLVGARRFLERVQVIAKKVSDVEIDESLEQVLHKSIKKVGEDIEELKMNTAISTLMIFANELYTKESVPRRAYETLLHLLSPFAPHLAEELWESLGHQNLLVEEPWPTFDENKVKGDTVVIAVQINGKIRGTFSAPRGLDEKEALNRAMELPNVVKWLDKKEQKRLIYITDRVLNIIV